jgi:hypothetical protein
MKSEIKIAAFILLLLVLTAYAVPADAATYYFGGANKQLSSATDEVTAGYYDATTLHAVDTDLAAGNIKKPVNIFGIVGTYEGAGGTNYGIPKTGQTTEYLDYDDGHYQKGLPVSGARFTDNLNGTITDNATGLMWIKDPSLCGGGTYPNAWASAANTPAPMTWANAIASCEALNYAVYGDWRLPNVKELQSIVDYGRANPTIDQTYFPNTQSNIYWSSTTFLASTISVFTVHFYYGDVDMYMKSENLWVRPVRGGQ